MTLEDELAINSTPPPIGFDEEQETIWAWSGWRDEGKMRVFGRKVQYNV